MTLHEILQVILARKLRFLLVLALAVVGTVVISMILPKTYVAEAALVINATGRDPLTGLMIPAQLSSNSVATQVDIISSHNVALKVVDSLKLIELREVQEQFRDATDGVGSIRDWIADKLLDRLTVKPSRESNVITIEFAATDPNFAAELANAFAEAYIQTSLELSMDPARRQTDWFDSQQTQMRTKLQEAKQRLSEYQQKQSIVGTDDRLDVEGARLAEISNQLVLAQTAMYDAQSRQQQMKQAIERGQAQQLPDILGNSLLQSMKADVARAESKLAETAERYGRNHPLYISASAEVQSLRNKFTNELETAKGSISQASQIAQQRVAEIQKSLDKQRDYILKIKDQRNGSDVLNRDVENAQRAFDALSLRASEVRLASQMNQSTVSTLNHAVAPLKPAQPRMLLNLVLSIIVGSMLSTVIVLAAELTDARVRAAASIVASTGMLVLAEIPRISRRPQVA